MISGLFGGGGPTGPALPARLKPALKSSIACCAVDTGVWTAEVGAAAGVTVGDGDCAGLGTTGTEDEGDGLALFCKCIIPSLPRSYDCAKLETVGVDPAGDEPILLCKCIIPSLPSSYDCAKLGGFSVGFDTAAGAAGVADGWSGATSGFVAAVGEAAPGLPVSVAIGCCVSVVVSVPLKRT